jgi:hypothetical protein
MAKHVLLSNRSAAYAASTNWDKVTKRASCSALLNPMLTVAVPPGTDSAVDCPLLLNMGSRVLSRPPPLHPHQLHSSPSFECRRWRTRWRQSKRNPIFRRAGHARPRRLWARCHGEGEKKGERVRARERERERDPFCISTNAHACERTHAHTQHTDAYAHTQHTDAYAQTQHTDAYARTLTHARTHAPRTHTQGDFEGAIKAYTRCLDLDADNTSGLCFRV